MVSCQHSAKPCIFHADPSKQIVLPLYASSFLSFTRGMLSLAVLPTWALQPWHVTAKKCLLNPPITTFKTRYTCLRLSLAHKVCPDCVTLPQVLALCVAPFLLEHPDVRRMFPTDAITRAKKLLDSFSGGVGAYTDSRGKPWLSTCTSSFKRLLVLLASAMHKNLIIECPFVYVRQNTTCCLCYRKHFGARGRGKVHRSA